MHLVQLFFFNYGIQAQLLKDILDGTSDLNPRIFDDPKFSESKPPTTAFKVAQNIKVVRRTEVGVCKPGGSGRIDAVHVSRSGIESYDVTYVVDNRREYALPASMMTARMINEGRPIRRASTSATSQTGKQQRQIVVHRCHITLMHFQYKRQRLPT